MMLQFTATYLTNVTPCHLKPSSVGLEARSSFRSVLCCRLHLLPAVFETYSPHFLLQISFQIFFAAAIGSPNVRLQNE